MLRVAFALSFWLAAAVCASAQPVPEIASQLASRIFSLLPHRTTVSLEFQTLTALPQATASSFRGALEEELRKAGLEVVAAAPPESRIRVTISENLRGLLLAAEAPGAVALLPWNAPSSSESKPRLRMVKTPILEQTDPVLDFLLLDSGTSLLVLSPARVSSYRLADGKWTPTGSVQLGLTRPMTRDARGRMDASAGALHAYVSGSICTGTVQQLKMTCAAGNDAWPLNPRNTAFPVRWVNDRNLLEAEGVRGPFYSAAGGLLASVDGRIVDRAGEPAAGTDGWGSDLAGVENSCGSSTVILATRTGGAQDQVQAYDVANGQAVPASDPLYLAGPVTALWPAEADAQATLVIRNSKTGNYEASRLGLACAE